MFTKARACFEAGDVGHARHLLGLILQQRPDSPRCLHLLALISDTERKPAEAELFTIRNCMAAGGEGNRPYAEKIMISRRDQLTPMHRHLHKIEDIINHASLTGDATLSVKLCALHFNKSGRGLLFRFKPTGLVRYILLG